MYDTIIMAIIFATVISFVIFYIADPFGWWSWPNDWPGYGL